MRTNAGTSEWITTKDEPPTRANRASGDAGWTSGVRYGGCWVLPTPQPMNRRDRHSDVTAGRQLPMARPCPAVGVQDAGTANDDRRARKSEPAEIAGAVIWLASVEMNPSSAR
jgi:hypothetical protein